MNSHLSMPPNPDAAPAGRWRVTVASHPPGFRSVWRTVDRAQLIYPSRGVMTLRTRKGSWVVPPLRGYWLPAGEAFRVETATGLDVHTVCCDGLASMFPTDGGVVPISPLLREMILALAGASASPGELTPLPRIGAMLAGQLQVQGEPPLSLPAIGAGRLRRIADALEADPGDARTLEDWARELAISARTLARAFQREAGMPFREFRRQVRLHAAMERLAEGRSVTTVAHELGFGSATNFSTMFRRATGKTPRTYFASRSAR